MSFKVSNEIQLAVFLSRVIGVEVDISILWSILLQPFPTKDGLCNIIISRTVVNLFTYRNTDSSNRDVENSLTYQDYGS